MSKYNEIVGKDAIKIKLHKIGSTQWYLTGDRRQFVLATEKRRQIKKTDPITKRKVGTGEYEDYLEGESFFRELPVALREYTLMKVRLTKIESFKEFAEELHKMNIWLEEIRDAINFQITNKGEVND